MTAACDYHSWPIVDGMHQGPPDPEGIEGVTRMPCTEQDPVTRLRRDRLGRFVSDRPCEIVRQIGGHWCRTHRRWADDGHVRVDATTQPSQEPDREDYENAMEMIARGPEDVGAK